MVLSSIRRPRDDIGSTSSQVPDSLVIDASKRARVLGSGAFSKRASAEADTFKVSQAFWRYWATPSGGAWSCLLPTEVGHHPHGPMESLGDEVGQYGRQGRRRQQPRPERQRVQAALRSGCPVLIFTGRVACVQAGSLSLDGTFVICSTIDLRSLSSAGHLEEVD